MSKISLLLPTRGRPHLVQRFFQSLIAQTANLKDVEVVLYVDEDDLQSHHLNCDGVSLVRIIGPRLSMGAYNQTCLDRSSGEIVILMNDDVVIRTPDWDQIVVDVVRKIPDQIYLAYPTDLYWGNMLCTFPILPRRVCEIMARPFPDEYQSWHIDRHILDIFKRLKHMDQDRIFYLHHVVFEHLHFDYGKAALDLTYQSKLRSKVRYGDDWAFVALRDLRQVTAERLHATILGKALPELPQKSELPPRPKSLFQALRRHTSVFLFDFALPIRERLRLFTWMTARSLRWRGYLPAKYTSLIKG